MPIEQFKNGAASTLTGNGGSITAALTTFLVANGSLFPANGVFRALCGTELMMVGARSGNTFTNVTRGIEFTTAAIHTDGDAITHVITADAMKNLVTPARVVLTPPPSTGWTWDNQGGSTIVDDGDSQVIIGDGAANIATVTGQYRAAPATPYVITAMIVCTMVHKAYQGYGLYFRQSSDGKLHGNVVMATDLGLSVYDLKSTKYTSSTVFLADYQILKTSGVLWFRIADDGTNRICSVSSDGLNFLTLHTIGRTDHLTANQVGWYISKQNAAVPNLAPIARLVSWAVS